MAVQYTRVVSFTVPGLSECSPEEGFLPEKPVSGTLRDLYQPEGSEQPHSPTPWRVHRSALYLWAKQGSWLYPAGLHGEAVRHHVSVCIAWAIVNLHWVVAICFWSLQGDFYIYETFLVISRPLPPSIKRFRKYTFWQWTHESRIFLEKDEPKGSFHCDFALFCSTRKFQRGQQPFLRL